MRFCAAHTVSCRSHVSVSRSSAPCLWLCCVQSIAFFPWQRQGNSDLIAVSLWNHAHLPPRVIWLSAWLKWPARRSVYLLPPLAFWFESWLALVKFCRIFRQNANASVCRMVRFLISHTHARTHSHIPPRAILLISEVLMKPRPMHYSCNI